MRLGDLEFHVVNDGPLLLDGGAMFGVIPRTMWQKKFAPDADNRILLAMNCLLVRTAGKIIVVETGAGDKWDAKSNAIYGFASAGRLPQQLAARGVLPGQVDLVVNTHLHFDHCGWNTHLVDGKCVPFFPNARYMVQAGELEHAKHSNERDHANYRAENFAPIEAAGQWSLLEGDREIAPGVELLRVPGHTRDMQCVRLSGGGKAALFFADLIPTAAHLGLAWIMSFDSYPITTLEHKKQWLARTVREGWLALFAHDPAMAAGCLRDEDGHYRAEALAVE